LNSYGKEITYKKINVEIRELESLNLNFSIEIIKIDVEGAELEVLKGMESILKKNRPIFMIENSDYENVTNFLQNAGYGSYQYLEDKDRLVPIRQECTNSFYIHEEIVKTVLGLNSPK